MIFSLSILSCGQESKITEPAASVSEKVVTVEVIKKIGVDKIVEIPAKPIPAPAILTSVVTFAWKYQS